ncbi:hypothetical protein [Tepidanaerobacter syntrophicus]|uniref:hypothetical protein n=1 Tax=Tepidanaerobacter syntrophicus TaxID=224999 RepID=UPI001BD60574|nr:hypothetical protein [Tepidanaerobacter syntrophicus]
MGYGIGIKFPMELTKEDLKKLKLDIAHNKFGVMNGGKPKSTSSDKTKPASKKD